MQVQQVIRTRSGDTVTGVWEAVDTDFKPQDMHNGLSKILADPNQSLGLYTDDGVAITRVAAIEWVRVRTRSDPSVPEPGDETR